MPREQEFLVYSIPHSPVKLVTSKWSLILNIHYYQQASIYMELSLGSASLRSIYLP